MTPSRIRFLPQMRGLVAMMVRDLEAVDKELRFYVSRRAIRTREISGLSAQVVQDTALIDKLLAERSTLMPHPLLRS